MDAEKLNLARQVADLYDRETMELVSMAPSSLLLLRILSDGNVHTAIELNKCLIAEKSRAFDGLRRVRELRNYGFNVIAAKFEGIWAYRIPMNVDRSLPVEGEIVRCEKKLLPNSTVGFMSVQPRTLVLDSTQYVVK